MSRFNKTQLVTSPQFILIKNNLIYGVAILIFLFLGISFLPQQLIVYTDLKNKNNELDAEISKQEARLRLIESVNVTDLNQLLLILNTLYPQQEDQFSIYPVVDNLQAVTGMLFLKKTSPFAADSKAKVVMTIDAVGTLDQVKILLRDYPYKSARILSLENLLLRPNKLNPQIWDISFTITFHTKEIAAGSETLTGINPMALAFARQAEQYFTSRGAKYTKISVKDEDIPLNYPIKLNPFK